MIRLVIFFYAVDNSRARMLSWRFLCLNFSPDCVAISRDIPKYGKDVYIWFKRKILDFLNPILMLNLLSEMRFLPDFIYKKPPTSNTSTIIEGDPEMMSQECMTTKISCEFDLEVHLHHQEVFYLYSLRKSLM